jgi:hypothetical protein
MGLRAALEERKILHLPGIEPQSSSPWPASVPTELPQLQVTPPPPICVPITETRVYIIRVYVWPHVLHPSNRGPTEIFGP